MTWNSKANMPTTASSRSGIRSRGSRHTYRTPSASCPALLATLGDERIAERSIRTGATSTAMYVSMLTAKHHLTPTVAIIAPATAGPTTREPVMNEEFSATAFGTSSRSTRSTTSVRRTGLSKAVTHRRQSTDRR